MVELNTLKSAEEQEVEDRCRFSSTDVETFAESVESKGSVLAESLCCSKTCSTVTCIMGNEDKKK